MEIKIKRKHDCAIDGTRAVTNYSADFALDLPFLALQTTLDASVLKMDGFEAKRLHNLGFEQKLLNDIHIMQSESWAIAKLVEEYAKAIHDDVLEHQVGFHKSDLTSGSIDKMKSNAGIVFTAATGPVVTAMVAAGYNITAARVAGLGTAIANVTADQGTPRANTADNVAAHELEIAECNNVLWPTRKSMLNLLAAYAVTKPLTYAAVADAFEVLDISIKHIADRLRVTDSVLKLRLHGALLEILELPTLPKKTSSELGIVDLSHESLPQGNYTFRISLKGYGTITMKNVPAYDNKMTIVDVPLEKGGKDITCNFPITFDVDGHPVINVI